MPRQTSMMWHLDPKCGKKSSCNRDNVDNNKFKYAHTCKFCGNKEKVMEMGKWTAEQLTTYRQDLRTWRKDHPVEKKPRGKNGTATTTPTGPQPLKVPTMIA